MSARGKEEVLITDLVERVTEGELSPKTSRKHWRIVEYELEKIGPGRGLATGEWKPGRVTIRLGLEGWHRIAFISQYSPRLYLLEGLSCQVNLIILFPLAGNDLYNRVETDNARCYLGESTENTGVSLIVPRFPEG